MISRMTNLITGLIGLLLFSAFVIGLAQSISTGFAGFLGGLPFIVIVAAVLCMVAYDFWDNCIGKSDK